MSSLGPRLFVALQWLLPHHTLGLLLRQVSRCRWRVLAQPLMRAFIRAFQVKVEEADPPTVGAYACFDDFFTRALRPGARPIDPQPAALVSPVDGRLTQAGPVSAGQLVQAKGRHYSLVELLADDARMADGLQGGMFLTCYLAPYNYHRIHMPLAGRLRRAIFCPGRLFSVNDATTAVLPRLFCRNERVVLEFETVSGPMAVVLVGALFVGSMSLAWQGMVGGRGRQPIELPLPAGGVDLQKGDELGRFHYGSTVILVLPPGMLALDEGVAPGLELQMGRRLATVTGA
jgi:phosphatidylserine decarboxylase